MTKLPQVDGREIISKYVNMSVRPEFYSGRGATHGDLNSKLLEQVYQGVLKEAGQESAERFVQFVADFDVLSATAFLNRFYEFCAAGCVDNHRDSSPADQIDFGPDDGTGAREAIGMISVVSFFGGGNERDDTGYIRAEFLRNHKTEYTATAKSCSGFGYEF